jgi:signal transduction histidine kinase
MVGLFAIFILACGLTHVMGIFTLWVPAYGWEGLVKAVTAVASVGTAVLLIPLLPRLVAIPSPATLQRANEALQVEAQEREKTEAMLRQSQKLEAIGQLTGGVAHDFNNLLGVVIGNLDRAKRKGMDTSAGTQAIDQALAGAERAARLTDQLLAFARQQPLQRRLHDVNAIVANMASLLSQTVGSRTQLELAIDPELPAAVLDRNQLENALLNLAVNARDAMEGQGGVLTLATRRNGPDEIEIRVTDTGRGMDPATLSRATDPFFTTKPVGKGSGLGLSQVQGTVEQLGGRLEIVSTPGTGTSVRLYLPTERTGNEA